MRHAQAGRTNQFERREEQTMSPFTNFVSRKVLGAVVVFGVFAASLAGFLVAGNVLTTAAGGSHLTTTSAAQATDAASTQGSGSADPADRAKLRADLRAAFKLQGDARRAALAEIKAKALAGDYGAAIERRAERRDIRHDLLVSLLPENFQQDLQALKAAPADQRKQLRAEMVAKALAGEYGPEVQQAAERLKALHQA
jgi:hypothetical protein